MNMAIETYQRIGGHKERIQQLHQRLQAAQPHTMDQMRTVVSAPIEIDIELAIALVTRRSLYDALKVWRPAIIRSQSPPYTKPSSGTQITLRFCIQFRL